MKRIILSARLFAFAVLIGCVTPGPVSASDHDDGNRELKGRPLNLTDLYVFLESEQNSEATAGDLIVIINTHDRVLPGYPSFYSTIARYELHVNRIADKDATPAPSGTPPTGDIVFRFTFGAPTTTSTDGVQTGTLTILKGGDESGSGTFTTTSLANSIKDTDSDLTTSSLTIDGGTFAIFSGVREDPFFFDVEQFFKVRANLLQLSSSLFLCTGAAASGAGVFNPASCAKDFTKNYNVNSIVIRIPRSYLQANSEETFDFWATISVPKKPIELSKVE